MSNKFCECNCGYTCDRQCGLPIAECSSRHYVRDCAHEFSGWITGRMPGGMFGTAVCKHCGLTALDHDYAHGP